MFAVAAGWAQSQNRNQVPAVLADDVLETCPENFEMGSEILLFCVGSTKS